MPNLSSNHDELREKIDGFIEKLRQNKIDHQLIERLQQAADNLDSPSAEWFSADIHKIFNSALLLEQLRSSYRKKAGLLGVFEIFRNVLVLAPIFLTWLALSQASAAYLEVTAANQLLLAEPFLLQWEKGFGGRLGLLTFSHVAIIDAILLAVIIILTFVAHWYQNIQVEKNDYEALHLTSEYDNLLWQLNSVYSLQSKATQVNVQLTKQMKEVVEELRQRGEDFQNILTAEQDRLKQLAKINQQQMADVQSVIGGFQAGATQLAAFSQGMQTSLASIESTTQQLSTGTQQVLKVQNDLNKNFHALEGRIGSFELVAQEVSKTLINNFTDLNYAAHVEFTQMNQQTDTLCKQTTILGSHVQDLVNNQITLQQFIQDEKNTKDTTVNSIKLVAINLVDIKDAFHDTCNNIVNTNQQLVQAYKETANGLNTINTNLNQLNNAANQINHVSITIEQVSQEFVKADKTLSSASKAYEENTNKMLSAISKLYGIKPPAQSSLPWWKKIN